MSTIIVPRGAAAIRRHLEIFEKESPAFFWCPDSHSNILLDQAGKVVGVEQGGAIAGIGGIVNPSGGSGRGIKFTLPTTLLNNPYHQALVVASIDDPSAVRGAFLKIGDGNDGVGYGGGGTTFDAAGGNVVALKEQIAWAPGTGGAAFQRGLNVFCCGVTPEQTTTIQNVTTGVEAGTGTTLPYTPGAEIHINGYTSSDPTARGSSARVHAVVVIDTALSNSAFSAERTRLFTKFAEFSKSYGGDAGPLFKKTAKLYFFPTAAGGGGATIIASTESLTLSTFAATVGSARNIAGALESLSLTPYAATVGSARAISAAVESISLGTYPATVSRDTAIAGGLESIALTANAASVTLGAAIAAAMEAIVLAANPAAVRLDAAIAAQLEAITITGLGATISTSSDVNIGAALESITLSVPQALVSSDRAISGGLESIQITANGATVTLGALIGAALESIALTSYGAGITLNVTLPGELEQINLTTLAAQIGLGSNVSALVEAITLTPFGATLTMTGEITAALESIGLTTFVASITGGESALTTPGLEFTIPVGRMHYAIPIGRIHFTIPRD